MNEFENVAIVRLTKVVHPQFALFQKWRADLRAGLAISPISDLVFSPIELSQVTEELLALAGTYRPGIYQLSGDRDLTYLEAAQLLAATLGLNAGQIEPKTCAEVGLPARGPRHTALEYRSPGLSGTTPNVISTLENIFRQMLSASN
jgi:dTDP-4-dehydrorhamnose reductase